MTCRHSLGVAVASFVITAVAIIAHSPQLQI